MMNATRPGSCIRSAGCAGLRKDSNGAW
jgi:hypothetical protein